MERRIDRSADVSRENHESPSASHAESASQPRIVERAVQIKELRIATAMSDAPRALLARVPLVVLPAANHPWGDYRPILDHFASERRVFALDWPGFGNSAKPTPAEFAYGSKSYAELLEGWMDGLGIARAVLLGNSVGAAAAIRYAAAHPKRVLGLLLVAPASFTPPGLARSLAARLLGNPAILRRVVGGFTSLYLGPTTAETEALVRELRARRDSPDYAASLAAYAALWRSFDTPGADLTEVAGQVSAPSIVVRGALDPIITEADLRRASEALGSANGEGGKRALEVILPDAGHLPFLQQPTRFFAVADGLIATAEVNAATPQ
jgi:pimeloyl-ACP methyl ester carboxylesterase